MFSVSTGGKTEKGASNTFQAYQASVSDAWDIEVSTQFSYLGEKEFLDWLIPENRYGISNFQLKVILAFDSFANDQI